jgi:hypothetical protein
MTWLDEERSIRADEALAKLAPSEKFVNVRLTPYEAKLILKMLGGSVRANGEIAGAIAAQGNLLSLKETRKC